MWYIKVDLAFLGTVLLRLAAVLGSPLTKWDLGTYKCFKLLGVGRFKCIEVT